ncbi:MAG: hypothetical protein ACRDPO_08100, partial [Streptosporangiaceae bacterium]
MSDEPPPQQPAVPEEEPPTAPDPAALDLTGGSPDVTASTSDERPRQPFGRILVQSIVEGNSVVVTVLAIIVAIVVGGLLIAFTDPVVLSAWGKFFSAPGNAIAQAWDSAADAYLAMFQGSIFNPHTVSAIFQQKSLGTAFSDGTVSQVFSPLSETAVNATPLIFAGLSVAL